MKIEANKSLRALNSFGFGGIAEWFCEPSSIEELREVLAHAHSNQLSVFMLGAGSNIVLNSNISGLVIKLNDKNITYTPGVRQTVVKVGAGANWHALVIDTVNRGLYGIENLTLIPGNAGAAPIQNIGAYGVELRDVLDQVEVLDLNTREEFKLSNADCDFGYRDSVFKSANGKHYAITSITLSLNNTPNTHTQYRALEEELAKREISSPTAVDISDAVASIRRAKLPDPTVLGNAGSFFKNPVVSNTQLATLQKDFPQMPHHASGETHSKIPAGWLLEKAGWKGYRAGDVGVHEHQALVLVNYGSGTSKQLLNLASRIRQSIVDNFGIELEQEPATVF